MRVETKRMLLGRSFLAAWLIACFSIAAGQTYPSLKKALTCGTFISLLDGSLKSQMVSFAIPVAAVLPWSDSFLQEYKSGFLKAAFPRTNRRLYVEGKVFSVMTSGFLVWIFAISTILLVNFVIFYPMEIKGSFPKEQFLESVVPYGIQLIWHMGFLLSAIILELYFMTAISKTRSGFTQWNGFWQMETGERIKRDCGYFCYYFYWC